MYTQKAKSNLKKLRTFRILFLVLFCILYVVLALIGNLVLLIIAAVLSFFLNRVLMNFLIMRYIYGPLSKDFNAHLFYEIIKQSISPNTEYSYPLVQACYFAGYYQDVINTCNKISADEMVHPHHKVVYLLFLANVYYDLDNFQGLSETCEQIQYLNAQFPSKKNKLFLQSDWVFNFYLAYIKKDFATCLSLTEQPSKNKLQEIKKQYFQARISLVLSKKEEAAKKFQELYLKTKNLNYSTLSAHGLEAIAKDIPYCETFANTELPKAPATPAMTIKKKRIFKLGGGIGWLCVILALICIISLAVGPTKDQDYENDIWEYKENIRNLVETEYDAVHVLTCFNLEQDGTVLDSMFICRTQSGILLGSLYTYKGQEDLHYDVKGELPFSEIGDTPFYLTFQCTTSDYFVKGFFTTDKKAVSEDALHLSKMIMNEKLLYFAVTEIGISPIP